MEYNMLLLGENCEIKNKRKEIGWNEGRGYRIHIQVYVELAAKLRIVD